jgi:hypothetical protein
VPVRAGIFLSRIVMSKTVTPMPPMTQATIWNPLSVAAEPKAMPIRLEEKIAPK